MNFRQALSEFKEECWKIACLCKYLMFVLLWTIGYALPAEASKLSRVTCLFPDPKERDAYVKHASLYPAVRTDACRTTMAQDDQKVGTAEERAFRPVCKRLPFFGVGLGFRQGS